MRFVVAARLDELDQARVALLKFSISQPATKQFVPQPHLVSANYVGLAVVCDLLDLALSSDIRNWPLGDMRN